MAENVLYEDAVVRITNVQASFGSRTYSVDDIKNVEGYYQRPTIVWVGVGLAVLGVLLVFLKSFFVQYDTNGLYNLLSIIALPMIAIGGGIFIFASKYAIRLHTNSGSVEDVFAARNRAYAQKVIDALGAAIREKATRPASPARKNKR
jgi:hypothetical protein